jgi:catechol 2,3-dioxygenase
MNRSQNGVLQASLHHIGLRSQDPQRLADFYERVMSLRLRSAANGILGEAKDRRLYFVHGPAGGLAFAAYAVADGRTLDELAGRLRERNHPFERLPADELFEEGTVAVNDPDGNTLHFGLERPSEQTGPDGELPARLQHTVVASRAAARLAEFYQETLGFALSDKVVDEVGGLRTAFLRCSPEHHSFAVFQASENRLDHHCYETADWWQIRNWGDWFSSKQVRVEWGPGRHGPGNNLFLFVHDIDGNWLEISAELEVVATSKPAGEWLHEERTLNLWGAAPLRS